MSQDLRLATEVQEQLYRSQRQKEIDADEEFARKLQMEFEHQEMEERRLQTVNSNSRAQQVPLAPTPQAPATTLRTGQTAIVKLQHVASGNNINEPVYAHFKESNEMMLELAQRRGFVLRVKENGSVEFTTIIDENSRFIVDAAPGGNLYLFCRSKRSATNINGGIGWALALTREGELIGNAGMGPHAAWRLVASLPTEPVVQAMMQPQQPQQQHLLRVPNPPLHQQQQQFSNTTALPQQVVTATSVTHAHQAPLQPRHQQQQQQIQQIRAPQRALDLSSSVEDQWLWLQSPSGQMFIEKDETLKRMYRDGSLKRVLHRPDWPKVAKTWRNYGEMIIPTAGLLPEEHFELPSQVSNTYINEGFFKCYQVIPKKLIDNALQLTNFWLGRHELPPISHGGNYLLCGEILQDQSLQEMIFETRIIFILQQLYGLDWRWVPNITCQISVRFPLLGETPSNETLSGRRWAIDADYQLGDLVIAIPLVSYTEPFHGNVCLFPEGVKKIVEKRRTGALDANSHIEMDMSKDDMGECTQANLNAGDAMFMVSNMPRREAPNYSPNIVYHIYFRVRGPLLSQTK